MSAENNDTLEMENSYWSTCDSIFKKIFMRCKKNYGLTTYSLEVDFCELLSIEQTVKEISCLSNPQVIVWYIGCYGLRKTGVEFYKNCLFHPTFKNNMYATFWLVDLTAWGAFKNRQGSILKKNSCCDRIESFSDERIKCIQTAKTFQKMQEISSAELVNYFKVALAKKFVWEASEHFSNNNICIREIFSNNCMIMSDWYDSDAAKSYSVFQYFEGCLIVEEIFIKLLTEEMTDDFQIVFAIPNDEIKYYKDMSNSFRDDVLFLISRRCADLDIKKFNLQIKFLAFQYGTALQDRPYNAPGRVLKGKHLSYEDVLGSAEGRSTTKKYERATCV